MVKLKKIKVNFANNLFWKQPSLITYFRGYAFGYIPYHSLKELVVQNKLLTCNCYFSFNRLQEKNYPFFNQLFALKKLTFRLSSQILNQINKQGFVYEQLNESLRWLWDHKTLNWIHKGFIPFVDLSFLIDHFSNQKQLLTLTWHKNQFITLS